MAEAIIPTKQAKKSRRQSSEALRQEPPCTRLVAHERAIVDAALAIIESHIRKPGAMLDSSRVVKDYLRLQIGMLPHECFAVAYLDSQHRLIELREMFRGTLTQTSVYPREIVREALELNAGAVVLAHNHPSGEPYPSKADEVVTRVIKEALQLVDVRVVDHLVVGAKSVSSFAEMGLL